MGQDEFTKLFNYMEKRFDAIEGELAKKANTDDMNNRFDQVLGAVDDLSTEQAALISRVDRHEGWIHEISDHVGLTLFSEGQ